MKGGDIIIRVSKWFALTDLTLFIPWGDEELESFELTPEQICTMCAAARRGVEHCDPEEKRDIEEYVYFLDFENETHAIDIYGNVLVSAGIVDGRPALTRM